MVPLEFLGAVNGILGKWDVDCSLKGVCPKFMVILKELLQVVELAITVGNLYQ